MTDINREIYDVLRGKEPPVFGGKPGEPIPEVEPDDVRIIWNANRDVQAQRSGEQIAIDLELFRRICSPDANIPAVWQRTAMIHLLDMILPELLSQWRNEGDLDAKVFRAAASIPLQWQAVGVVRQGFPFDIGDFVRRVTSEAN
jgi:hypothetical protein